MRIEATTIDAATLDELGQRMKRRRIELGETQAALAERAGVSRRTLTSAEGGASVATTNLVRILRALGALGELDGILEPPGPSPLEQLDRANRARSRRRRAPNEPASRRAPWGDESGGS
ncbi:helix-turn-helix domain-containing protein [Thermoleophilia bacterium SCSIO 60948]|nr:helix-turn-helix domain-containing protein [Thermoleophilia bacterium SCSIO 60948]